MITNERQYRITKKKADKFVEALEEFDKKESERMDVPPKLIRAERQAMETQLTALRREVEEYEQIRDGGVPDLAVHSIDDLPEFLIKARIASRMTQRELAVRVQLHEQQIQRYESEGYASASFRRVRQVANALGVGLRSFTV